jgi:hypothetical protein
MSYQSIWKDLYKDKKNLLFCYFTVPSGQIAWQKGDNSAISVHNGKLFLEMTDSKYFRV